MIVNASIVSDAIVDLDSAYWKLERGGLPKVAEDIRKTEEDLRKFLQIIDEV